MRVIQIGGGVILIALALFLSFGIIGYSLKEGDEEIFTYSIIPLSMMAVGIFLIAKNKKLKSDSD